MRIRKPTERWFRVPDDEDGARIKIKALTPKDKFDITDAVFQQEIIYDEHKKQPEIKQTTNRDLDRELTAIKAIVEWEKVFDENEKPMELTEDNIKRAIYEVDGFFVFVKSCIDKLESDIQKEKGEQEKN